jgi:hypothetical protein
MLTPTDVSLMTDRTLAILDSIDEWDEPTRIDVTPLPMMVDVTLDVPRGRWDGMSDDEIRRECR